MINNGMSWLSLGNYINPKARNTELSNDYNQLTNRPIITLTGTSQNPIKLWKLDVGLYILNGYVQHTDALLSEARGLFVSATVGIVNGKYVISAFIPFWEGQYEYILPSLSSETYTEHQMIRMITQGNSLTLDNIREYFPTQDYHPTTKKYVDETMDAIRNELGKMGLNNNDVQSLIKENRRRDIAIQALLSVNSDKMVTINEEVHNISMDYSLDEGIATINTLEGSTLVNVSKDTEYDKILSYEQDIVENTNTVDLEADGNLNPIIVGDTLVNVCTQNNPTAITNEYTVEGNNHFALQDEVEGNCRPIIQGNTIVNRSKTKDVTPLTTYVSEVEGNEMSLVDDTDTHVRVDKLVGDTMVNLWRKENVITSYRVILENHRIKCTTDTNKYHNFFIDDISMIKPSTTYTCIVNIYKNTLNEKVWIFSKNIANNEYDIYTQSNSDGWCIKGGKVGQFKLVFTTPTKITATRLLRSFVTNESQIEGQEVELDVMLLEGDYTNKPIPQEYFEGLKNSYESECIEEAKNLSFTITGTPGSEGRIIYFDDTYVFKPNTTYTVILDLTIVEESDNMVIRVSTNRGIGGGTSINLIKDEIKENHIIRTFTTNNYVSTLAIYHVAIDPTYGTSLGKVMINKLCILEGDYSSNPLIYEEVMEHGGKYRCKVEVQGKNLFDGKLLKSSNSNDTHISVTDNGNGSYSAIGDGTVGRGFVGYFNAKVKPNTKYIFNYKIDGEYSTEKYFIYIYKGKDKIWSQNNDDILTSVRTVQPFTIPNNVTEITIAVHYMDLSESCTISNIQLEEGDTATAYEPYYNQTQTVYLNSPLLKGDEVVYKEGKLCHYHKMSKVVLDGDESWAQNYSSGLVEEKTKIFRSTNDFQDILPGAKLWVSIKCENFKQIDASAFTKDNEGMIPCSGWWDTTYRFGIRIDKSKLSTQNTNGFKQWLQQNPTTIVYELANPYYETISTSELCLPITTNCKLLTSSNIPLTTMSTRVFTEEVNILANTQYSLNFNSNVASTVNITLGGTVLSNQAIAKGYNKFSITTPSTLVDKNSLLIIEGSGVNISEVVVTEYDEGVCEYIEGLKSSFEDGYIPSEEDNLVSYNISDYQLKNATLTISNGIHQLNTTAGAMFCIKKDSIELHPSTKYTIFIDVQSDSALTNSEVYLVNNGSTNKNISRLTTQKVLFDFSTPGLKRAVVTSQSIENWDSVMYDAYIYFQTGESSNNFRFKYMILEGDWTHLHLTKEDFNHLGQYKVEYKVVGKNKFNPHLCSNLNFSIGKNGEISYTYPNGDGRTWNYQSSEYKFKLNKGNYKLTITCIQSMSSATSYRGYDLRTKDDIRLRYRYGEGFPCQAGEKFTTDLITLAEDTDLGLMMKIYDGVYTVLIEKVTDGVIVGEYEPYKESIQTVYLNSPLLEGDTIEEIDGEVYHIHRRKKTILNGSENWKEYNSKEPLMNFVSEVIDKYSKKPQYNVISDKFITKNYNRSIEGIFISNGLIGLEIAIDPNKLGVYDANGFKQWLSENPATIIYELENPIYELIPSSSIVCKSYPNGHLDFDTNVHIDNTVNFVKANLPITYANTSTNYKLQFVSDKDMENVTINALGNIMENVTITKGLNKISFTSPSDATNILTFEGIGYAYISDVQLVATEKDIDYFKGLYSTYECGLIEDESDENYGKYEVNIVSYNTPIQFGKGGKIK